MHNTLVDIQRCANSGAAAEGDVQFFEAFTLALGTALAAPAFAQQVPHARRDVTNAALPRRRRTAVPGITTVAEQ